MVYIDSLLFIFHFYSIYMYASKTHSSSDHSGSLSIHPLIHQFCNLQTLPLIHWFILSVVYWNFSLSMTQSFFHYLNISLSLIHRLWVLSLSNWDRLGLADVLLKDKTMLSIYFMVKAITKTGKCTTANFHPCWKGSSICRKYLVGPIWRES